MAGLDDSEEGRRGKECVQEGQVMVVVVVGMRLGLGRRLHSLLWVWGLSLFARSSIVRRRRGFYFLGKFY